jgi:hypothetical protein
MNAMLVCQRTVSSLVARVLRSKAVRLLVLCACLLALSSSCGFGAGRDYAVTVTWLINGTAPSLSLCQANGVDRIRFTVRTPSKKLTLEAPCESSISLADPDTGDLLPYGGFTTTNSFNYEVSYRYEVAMLDRNGNPLSGLRYEDSFQIYSNDEQPWPLRPLELFAPLGDTASVDAQWDIAGAAPTSASCASLGASEVAIDVASSTDYDFVDSVEVARAECVDGRLVTQAGVLAEGEYWVRYVALDAKGDDLQSVYADDLYQVSAPGQLEVQAINFELP